MPLKTKRISPQAKTTKHGKIPFRSSKNVVTKTTAKSAAVGKKPLKKPSKTKAGYELYSSGSESDDRLTSENKPQRPQLSSQVTTLVEEWMAKQGDEVIQVQNPVSRPAGIRNIQRERCPVGPSEKTPFNKRLVSSTPDPDLQEEDEGDQLIPERDFGLCQGATPMPSPRDAGGPESGIPGLLTESQREHLRQQIDAVLLEEGQVVEKLQQHRATLQQVQPRLRQPTLQVHLKQSVGASSQDHQPDNCGEPDPTTAPTARQKAVPVQQHVVTQERSAPASAAHSTWRDIMSASGLPDRTSDIGVFHHFLHRDSAPGLPPSFMQSEDGERKDRNCQVFVPQAGAGFAPDVSMGFVPVGEHTSRFKPYPSGTAVGIRHGLQSHRKYSSLDENQTLPDQDCRTCSGPFPDQVQVATPACSPARHHSQVSYAFTSKPLEAGRENKHNTLRQEGKKQVSDRTNKQDQKNAVAELQTPATSPEEIASCPAQRGLARLNLQQRQQQLSPKSCIADRPLASCSRAIRGRAAQTAEKNVGGATRKRTSRNNGKVGHEEEILKPLVCNMGDNYTSDGYFINGTADVKNDGGDGESAPEPRAFLPTPMHSPKILHTHPQDDFGLPLFEINQDQLNVNNSSDTHHSQQDADYSWMRSQRRPTSQTSAASGNLVYPMPDFLSQDRPAREAMADTDLAALPLSVARAMMMMAEDQDGQDADLLTAGPAPSQMPVTPVAFHGHEGLNGPRKLRQLLHELKQICAIDGDMEVGQLLQEVTDLVEVMPQLKVTFNLQAEIDLALQPLRNENSQLRRRLRILNQQLKERERREKEDTNPGMNFEMLHLQTENASLQRQLKEEREGCMKLTLYIAEQQQQVEKASKELQQIQCKLTEREHDKLLTRQEHTQNMNRLHQEVEMMSRRNESVQLKLASADRENNILQLNLKQRDMEIARLHTVLGNLKQGVAEVLQYFDQSMGDLNTSDNVIQKLLSFLKSSSQAYILPKDDLLSRSSEQEPLERSGNQRSRRLHKEGRGSIDPGPAGPVLPRKDGIRQGSTSSLTEAAIAAHNRHLDAVKDRAEVFARKQNVSFHSWDGVDLQRSHARNRSQLYHSDPESMVSPPKKAGTSGRHHHHRDHNHQQKQQHLQNSQQLLLPGEVFEVFDHNHSNHLSSGSGGTERLNINDNRAEIQLEEETLNTLSEMTMNETDMNKVKVPPDTRVTDTSRHSLTEYFKKYPDSKPTDSKPTDVRPKVLPKLDSSRSGEDQLVYTTEHSSPGPKMTLTEKSPPISSPNASASLILSASDTTQKDYFHGTELDLSLSTIQEDALSSVTGTTFGSVATAMSLDDRAFREGIATLDENIAKVHEALQRTKKMFS